ncbi:MAG: hypothetical protein KF802_03045 [Bdellovibrionaceae bacterium]|nr:hypothetical protein [Pseudobdellovibrionaceae bacterium]
MSADRQITKTAEDNVAVFKPFVAAECWAGGPMDNKKSAPQNQQKQTSQNQKMNQPVSGNQNSKNASQTSGKQANQQQAPGNKRS